MSVSHTQQSGKQHSELTRRGNEHLANIRNNTSDTNTTLTNGTQVATIKGSDGSTIHGDGNGNVKANVINSININPANSSNADHANYSGHALATALKGRQSINDHTSSVFLLADSSGHLQTDVANQPNVKVEDLSSSLNAQHASGTSRSLAVGIKGAQNISDVPSSSTFLLCDAAGHLQVDVVSAPSTAVTGTVTANLSATDNAVLDDIAQKAGDIETAVQALDDIVKTEDAVHSSGDKGVMFLGVRQSSQADFGADGDYVPISINDDGEIRVTSSSVSGGATEAKQDIIEATLTAIETDQAALEVLHTSTNSKLDTIDTVLDTIKVDTEAIETAVEALNARDSLTTTLIIDGQSVSSGGGSHTSSSVEITNRPKGDGKLHFLLRIATVAAGDIQMTFQGSADDTNFFTIPLSFVQTENTTTGVGQVGTLSFVPKHLKITLTNNNFSSAATCSVHMFN